MKLPIELDRKRQREHLLAAGCPPQALGGGGLEIVDDESWQWVGDRVLNGEGVSHRELQELALALLKETTKTRGALDAANAARKQDSANLREQVLALRAAGWKVAAVARELGIEERSVYRLCKT